MVAGDAFAAIDLGHALSEPLVEGGLADFEPLLLRFEEVEGLGDDLGGGGVVAAVEFALDALFGCGIEGDRHGGSIPLAELDANPTHAVGLHEWRSRPMSVQFALILLWSGRTGFPQKLYFELRTLELSA